MIYIPYIHPYIFTFLADVYVSLRFIHDIYVHTQEENRGESRWVHTFLKYSLTCRHMRRPPPGGIVDSNRGTEVFLGKARCADTALLVDT